MDCDDDEIPDMNREELVAYLLHECKSAKQLSDAIRKLCLNASHPLDESLDQVQVEKRTRWYELCMSLIDDCCVVCTVREQRLVPPTHYKRRIAR